MSSGLTDCMPNSVHKTFNDVIILMEGFFYKVQTFQGAHCFEDSSAL